MLVVEKLDGCDWGSSVTCDELHRLTDDEFHQIGRQLADNQVVVIRDQEDASPFELQKLCSKVGDLEGYTSKLKIYADPNTPEARADWATESQSDEEFGGEKLGANLEIAKSSLNAFGTDAFKSLLSESGLGNHPEVIRFMYRAGKAIGEDGYVGNSQGANAKGGVPKDFNGIANALYSNQQN